MIEEAVSMFGLKSRIGAIIAGCYLLIVFVTMLIPYIGRSAELGMFPFIATLPWSFLIALAVNPFLSNEMIQSELAGIIMLSVSALINATIIYFIVKLLAKDETLTFNPASGL